MELVALGTEKENCSTPLESHLGQNVSPNQSQLEKAIDRERESRVECLETY